MRTTSKLVAIALCALLSGACAPEAPSDDAGNLNWVRRVVRQLLHRNLKGADEARLLVDLVEIVGRREVARMLMAEPEFAKAQTHQLMVDLEVQVDSSPLPQPATCFGGLERLPESGDGGALARWVRDRSMQESILYGGGGVVSNGEGASGPWNFVDLAYSSILEDDLRPLFKAYMIPAVVGREYRADQGRDGIGLFFNRVFLNRDVSCTTCHTSQYSVTNSAQWVRTHPLPIAMEQSLWGCLSCAGEISQINGVFRQDASGTHTDGAVLEPWGMDPECGSLAYSSTEGAIPTHYAGLDGDAYGVADLVDQFGTAVLEPYQEFRCLPMNPLDATSYDVIPGDEAFVFGVASTLAQNAWTGLMGSPLALSHGFARNDAQMLLHCELTERVLRSGWSLRDLLAEIVTRREYNRRAPAQSTRPSAFELPLFFDPFTPVADPENPTDPCAGPDPLPATCFNGKGEQVVRYPPQQLLRRTHRMLGWPAPPLYPADADRDLARDLDQYLSTRYPGSDVFSFQNLLTWEHETAACAKPAVMGDAPDWIDRLVEAVAAFDASHPDDRLTLQDAVEVVRDWLLQDAALAAPGGGGLIDPSSTESARIAAALGVPHLGIFASSLGDELGDRLRLYCGVAVETPQYTLTEVPLVQSLTTPRIQVCNESPCGYQALCTHYRSTLASMGHSISCAPGGAAPALDLQLTPPDPDPDPRIDDLTTEAAVQRLAESASSDLYPLLEGAGYSFSTAELGTLQQILAKTPYEDLRRVLPGDLVESGGPSREAAAELDQLAQRMLTLGCLDRDADGTCDSKDLCPDWAARSHSDVDENGIGDDCECGDQDGDGRVTVRDLVEINRAIFDPSRATPLCDANGDGRCSVSDIVAANRKIFGAPAYCARYPAPRF